MRRILLMGLSVIAMAVGLSSAAQAQSDATTLNFSVMRDGQRIGTSTVRLTRQGQETIAEVAAHIRVQMFGLTVYRFDQTETEHWTDGRLMTMNSVTDDNGTIHKVSAKRQGDGLAIDADGRTSVVDGAVIPASLWNASLVQKTMALNLQTGTLTPVSVVDHGKEQLVLQGRPTTAHHYSINTSMAQEVWYDERHHLVRVEMRGSDGSRIHYQPG